MSDFWKQREEFPFKTLLPSLLSPPRRSFSLSARQLTGKVKWRVENLLRGSTIWKRSLWRGNTRRAKLIDVCVDSSISSCFPSVDCIRFNYIRPCNNAAAITCTDWFFDRYRNWFFFFSFFFWNHQTCANRFINAGTIKRQWTSVFIFVLYSVQHDCKRQWKIIDNWNWRVFVKVSIILAIRSNFQSVNLSFWQSWVFFFFFLSDFTWRMEKWGFFLSRKFLEFEGELKSFFRRKIFLGHFFRN